MPRGKPVAGYRRVKDKNTGELIIPEKFRDIKSAANDPISDNVVPFPAPRGKDAITVLERSEAGQSMVEIRTHFNLGLNDPKNPYSMEHTLTINDGKVDFISKAVQRERMVTVNDHTPENR